MFNILLQVVVLFITYLTIIQYNFQNLRTICFKSLTRPYNYQEKDKNLSKNTKKQKLTNNIISVIS